VLDFGGPERAMRLRSVHPGVKPSDVVAATGFPLAIPEKVPVTREPADRELELIQQLDPEGKREAEVR
jgi:acyl CoA:acetate/3-ketoacid CoA transferase beta subunit